MWIASGSTSRMRLATFAPGMIASGISGYVGIGNVLKPSGEITSTSWPQRRSHCTVFSSVTTTPFTCGAQASVTSRMRIVSPHVGRHVLGCLDSFPVDDSQLAAVGLDERGEAFHPVAV